MKNESIELFNKQDGVYIRFIPAEDGGAQLTLNDALYYFDKKKINILSAAALNAAMNEARTNGEAKVTDVNVSPFSGWCDYEISQDARTLTFIMYPPMQGGAEVTTAEVARDLDNMKVIYGINKTVLNEIVENKRYFEKNTLAEATPPIEGHDGEIKYNFNTSASTTPKMNEDGTVDFHKLDIISKVKAGDVVAQLFPEDEGVAGKDIYGKEIKQKKVEKVKFQYGSDLIVSADGLSLISEIDGQVSLKDGKISVSGEYEVPADVDTSTGDIDFPGSVRIKGNVLAGFSVKAKGDVRVDGVVEGARIEAGGNIILSRGIQGMHKGVLISGGDIVSTYIENATVTAKGNIDTGAILHSNVISKSSILIHGKNGYLIGGNVKAASVIDAKIIGSTMGTQTIIGVGADPQLVMQVEKLKKDITAAMQEKVKLTQLVLALKKKKELEGRLDAVKTDMLKKSLIGITSLDGNINEMRVQYQELSENVKEDEEARIKISGSIYPGTKIEMGDISLFIRDKNDYCQYVKRGADIVRINY